MRTMKRYPDMLPAPRLNWWPRELGMRTTRINGSYTIASGTSFAAPLVSGVAALMLSHYPNLTSMQLRAYLTMRADDLGEEGRDDAIRIREGQCRSGPLIPSFLLCFHPPLRAAVRYRWCTSWLSSVTIPALFRSYQMFHSSRITSPL